MTFADGAREGRSRREEEVMRGHRPATRPQHKGPRHRYQSQAAQAASIRDEPPFASHGMCHVILRWTVLSAWVLIASQPDIEFMIHERLM